MKDKAEVKRFAWMRYVAVFMIGLVIGSSVFLIVYGQRMEQLMLFNRNMRLLNERLNDELDNLKRSQKVAKKRQDMVVEEIKVTIVDPIDPKMNEFTSAEVIRRLEVDLAQIKGKKVEQVGEFQSLIHEMLRRREYVIERKIAEARVKTVVISRVLHIFVTVQIRSLESEGVG